MKSGLGGTLHARIAGGKPHAGRPRALLGFDGSAVSDHAVGKGRAAADHERSEQLGAKLVHDQVDGGIGKPAGEACIAGDLDEAACENGEGDERGNGRENPGAERMILSFHGCCLL